MLYSIGGLPDKRRDDKDQLPFRALWQRIQKEAASPLEDPNYKNAKTLMATLYQEILLSPDVTEPDADALVDEYEQRMKKIHTRAVAIGNLEGGATELENARVRAARAKALGIASS